MLQRNNASKESRRNSHQSHFKVVSCGEVVQLNFVPDVLETEMGAQLSLFCHILNSRGETKDSQNRDNKQIWMKLTLENIDGLLWQMVYFRTAIE